MAERSVVLDGHLDIEIEGHSAPLRLRMVGDQPVLVLKGLGAAIALWRLPTRRLHEDFVRKATLPLALPVLPIVCGKRQLARLVIGSGRLQTTLTPLSYLFGRPWNWVA